MRKRSEPKNKPNKLTVIKKRDGRLTQFNSDKITQACRKAFNACGYENSNFPEGLTCKIVNTLTAKSNSHIPNVEEIQDIVENILISEGYGTVAKAYILYRAKRSAIREGKSELMNTVDEIINSSALENPEIIESASSKMLKIASCASKNFYLKRLIPYQFAEAHKKGIIHIHDLDFYSKTINNMEIRFSKLIKEGFFTGFCFHRPAKRISTAMNLMDIILQCSQNDSYGDQLFSYFDSDLAKICKSFSRDEKEYSQAMQGFIYNLNTLYTKLGSSIPVSTINLGTDTTVTGRLITRSLLETFSEGLGKGETPLFPQIIFKVKKGINYEPDDPNYDLFKLALKTTSKCMNPSYCFSDSEINSKYTDISYWSSGDRIIQNETNKTTGSANIAHVSLNLVHLALLSKNMKRSSMINSFYSMLEKYTELSALLLQHKFEILSHLKVKELPFIMGEKLYDNSEDLGMENEIKKAVRKGNLSIGFIGLAEALTVLTGNHHGENKVSQQLGLEIINKLNDYIKNSRSKTNLNLILSASQDDGFLNRFVTCDRDTFGLIEGVTDKSSYSHSFHLPNDYKCNIDIKLSVESEYHKLTPGGHNTVIELGKRPDTALVEKIVKKMYDNNIGLASISFKINECCNCGSDLIKNNICLKCSSDNIRHLVKNTFMTDIYERLSSSKRNEIDSRKEICF